MSSVLFSFTFLIPQIQWEELLLFWFFCRADYVAIAYEINTRHKIL